MSDYPLWAALERLAQVLQVRKALEMLDEESLRDGLGTALRYSSEYSDEVRREIQALR